LFQVENPIRNHVYDNAVGTTQKIMLAGKRKGWLNTLHIYNECAQLL